MKALAYNFLFMTKKKELGLVKLEGNAKYISLVKVT